MDYSDMMENPDKLVKFLRSRISASNQLLEMRSEIGRMPNSQVKTGLIELIDRWYSLPLLTERRDNLMSGCEKCPHWRTPDCKQLCLQDPDSCLPNNDDEPPY